MAILDESRYVERFQFFNGQRLFESDLNGVEAFNREMRWLHNRSLHQPGIGNGFAVSGQKGDRQVTVGPGYAVDALGREIVLTDTHVEPIPPVAGESAEKPANYALTVSYAMELEESETREGVCTPRGVVRRRETPEFCWVPLRGEDPDHLRARPDLERAIRTGMKIIIAQVEIADCRLKKNVLVAHRRSARPSQQPYIACGNVSFAKWKVSAGVKEIRQAFKFGDAELTLGASVRRVRGINRAASLFEDKVFVLTGEVDTSAYQFQTMPSYFINVQMVGSPQEPSPTSVLNLFHRIEDPHVRGFRALLVVLVFGDQRRKSYIQWIRDNWKLAWMGIEG